MINNSYLLYRGPSLYNGEEIAAILTGLVTPSSNRKTGVMAQTWIIATSQKPTEAVKSGADAACCGDCPLRRSACYVNLVGVNQTWEGADNLEMAGEPVWDYLRRYSGLGLRLGAYGDPAVVPLETWLPAIQAAKFTTGYTHRWRDCDPRWRQYCLASVETEADAAEAQALGWSTFRVKLPDQPVSANEIRCRNQVDSFVKCTTCRLCNGTKNIVADVHGINWKVNNFKNIQHVLV